MDIWEKCVSKDRWLKDMPVSRVMHELQYRLLLLLLRTQVQ